MSNQIVPLKEELTNNFLATVQADYMQNFPVSVQSGVQEVMNIVNNNQTVAELYKNELQELPMSQSLFQDVCVQLNTHFTPHRKQKQIMLELEGKLSALDAAKNGCKKHLVKYTVIKEEVDSLQALYTKINEKQVIHLEDAYEINLVLNSVVLDESLIKLASSPEGITFPKVIASILNKIKSKLGDKLIKLEETERGLKSSQNLIKDSAIKGHHLREQVAYFNEEIEKSGLSFEASEMIYYVMYFTSEGEKQIRTGDRIDTGTFGAVAAMPLGLVRKIHSNWNFIKNAHLAHKAQGIDYFGYFWQDNLEEMLPKQTGPEEFEGVKISDVLKVETIRYLAAEKKENTEDESN